MTTDVIRAAPPSPWQRLAAGHTLPVATVVLITLLLWYLLAIALNAPQIQDRWRMAGKTGSTSELIAATWSMERPVLPVPDQIGAELVRTVIDEPVTSNRSLLYHAYVTASSTVVGFALGTLLGILLAIGIVHLRTLDKSLMPWIIASQTIPILAIAPMIIVVLGNFGFTGLLPKSIISMYLCFFPIVIGMVKGLRSPDPLQLDLMRSYSASRSQIFWKLRFPASVPFLFASLKVAIAISLVGAIVGELPTGAQAGLGARLLTGSYYGQTVQIWAALLMAAALGALLVYAMALIESLVLRRMGVQR
ncbi:MAG TPA: ABC transporter permease [Candidatus Polarisedimenticolia bacterium]|nr:ABC transporter permease [Candidatus Polarisedimenticolia bacterium]